MDLVGERDLLRLHAEKKGPDGMAAYRAEKNATASTACLACEATPHYAW